MVKAKVIFLKLIQGAQGYGNDDQRMVSRVFFTVDVEGNISDEACVDINQSADSNFETTSNIFYV